MKRHTRDTIIAEINKQLRGGAATNAVVMLMWQRLMLGDPEFWGPKFDVWCTKSNNVVPVEEVPDIDPFDRGGR
jgi:hypothetical protein